MKNFEKKTTIPEHSALEDQFTKLPDGIKETILRPDDLYEHILEARNEVISSLPPELIKMLGSIENQDT